MVLSAGSAKPMLAAISRCGSFVEFSLITVKATCPGRMCFSPSLREISLQLGGKIEETRTMLHAAMPALRSASSKLASLSRCLPTPLVRKIFLATNAMLPDEGASVGGLAAKEFPQWKSNKKAFAVSMHFPSERFRLARVLLLVVWAQANLHRPKQVPILNSP